MIVYQSFSFIRGDNPPEAGMSRIFQFFLKLTSFSFFKQRVSTLPTTVFSPPQKPRKNWRPVIPNGLPQHQMPLGGRNGLEEILPAFCKDESLFLDDFQAQTLLHAHNYTAVYLCRHVCLNLICTGLLVT